MIALSLIPLPYRIGLGALALAGAYLAGDIHGHNAENARLTAKWQPKLQHALDTLNASAANFKRASEQARANNHAYVVRINSLQDQITKERNDEYPIRIAAARAAIAGYVRAHPSGDPVHSGEGGASGIPHASGKPDEAPTEAVVPVSDLDACAQSYVTATGLQDWIRAQAAINRENNK